MRLHILLLSLTFVFVSCGKKDKSSQHSSADDGPAEEMEISAIDGSNVKGVYAATLVPMNNNIHFLELGKAALKRDGDSFTAYVKLKYGQMGTVSKQAIFTGRCPTMDNDLNKDAYIDIHEALHVIGKALIPLDGNLDSQLDGAGGYPVGDAERGAYQYKVMGSFSRMFSDLKTPDTNPQDYVTKLKPGEDLELEGRIVILQGLHKKKFLPPSVISLNGQSRHESIPVACGVLKKVRSLPVEMAEMP